MDVRIELLDTIHVARIRHVGPYADVGRCFDRLFRWAGSVGAPTGRVLTLSWDNSEAVVPEKLRWDACVELRTAQEPPPGIALGPVGRRSLCRLPADRPVRRDCPNVRPAVRGSGCRAAARRWQRGPVLNFTGACSRTRDRRSCRPICVCRCVNGRWI